MNKRIEELIVQAGDYVNETYTGPVPATFTGNPEWHKEFDKWTQFNEKFAELIVRECAEQIISKGTDWVDFAPSQTGVRPEYWNMAQQIKQHFGVK